MTVLPSRGFFSFYVLKYYFEGGKKIFTPLYILCSRAWNTSPRALDSNSRALNISSKPLNIKSPEGKDFFYLQVPLFTPLSLPFSLPSQLKLAKVELITLVLKVSIAFFAFFLHFSKLNCIFVPSNLGDLLTNSK